MSYAITLKPITIKEIGELLKNNTPITLSKEVERTITNGRLYLDKKIKETKAPIYGINTGFGSLCNTPVSEKDLEQLQTNLVMSHACGVGNQVFPQLVKLMLLLKIKGLSYGNSGVQLSTVKLLVEFYNRNILPVVYEQGSLGASGDLAPLAHLSLPLLGLGEVHYKGKIIKANKALKVEGLAPIVLKSKEGLALLNGTQFMSALGVWCILQSEQLINQATTIGTISLEGFNGRPEPFKKHLHTIRPHAGQIHVAEQISSLLKGSEIIKQIKTTVQDPYSFRCMPQVHGATYDTIQHVKNVFQTEINSVTDNPTIFPNEDEILSGGNFHGQPLALALDFLTIAISELGNISERRTYQLIAGLRELPPFLIKEAGLNSGFMIPQYTAASIVSLNKQLCTPSSADSVVSSNGQEDHVSMGANAATRCVKVIENVFTILAIELMNAAQALEFRRPLKSSSKIEALIKNYRKFVKPLTLDRILYTDIESSRIFLKKETI